MIYPTLRLERRCWKAGDRVAAVIDFDLCNLAPRLYDLCLSLQPVAFPWDQLLHGRGIANIIVEQRTGEYVLSRIRAGIVEQGAADLIEYAGVGTRMRREGIVHEGIEISTGGTRFRIDFRELTGKSVMVYGQTEITRDLMEGRAAAGLETVYEAENVRLDGITADRLISDVLEHTVKEAAKA